MKSSRLRFDLIEDPCINIRCQKNEVEIKHSIKYHILDGVSLVKFFYWLEKSKFSANLDEINVSRKLEDFRKENKNYFSPSFPLFQLLERMHQLFTIIQFKITKD